MHVPLAGTVAVHLEQRAVVRPAQFVTQCVTNREGLVEQAHIAQVGGVEALAELGAQFPGQGRQQLLAIGCTSLAALLELDDMPADLPAGLHLDGIHGTQRAFASLANQLTEAVQQRLQRRVAVSRCWLAHDVSRSGRTRINGIQGQTTVSSCQPRATVESRCVSFLQASAARRRSRSCAGGARAGRGRR
ncbi:hypothetical protein D3C78_1357060 [compost metagenome]